MSASQSYGTVEPSVVWKIAHSLCGKALTAAASRVRAAASLISVPAAGLSFPIHFESDLFCEQVSGQQGAVTNSVYKSLIYVYINYKKFK